MTPNYVGQMLNSTDIKGPNMPTNEAYTIANMTCVSGEKAHASLLCFVHEHSFRNV